MLRWVLFMAVLSGGTLMFQTMELLPRDEAWLVSGVIAALLVFAIPEGSKRRQPKDLILILLGVLGVYGIYLKFRPWLSNVIDRRIAMAVSILLLLMFVVCLLVPNLRRGTKIQTRDAR